MLKQKIGILGICLLSLTGLFSGCSNDDCPINNIVKGRMSMYSTKDEPVALNLAIDVIAVRPQGDSTIINKMRDLHDISIPLSYTYPVDTFILNYEDLGRDSIFIHHTQKTQLVSVDCGVAVFHTLTDVTSTHELIDSIYIHQSEVDYYERENIKIILAGN